MKSPSIVRTGSGSLYYNHRVTDHRPLKHNTSTSLILPVLERLSPSDVGPTQNVILRYKFNYILAGHSLLYQYETRRYAEELYWHFAAKGWIYTSIHLKAQRDSSHRVQKNSHSGWIWSNKGLSRLPNFEWVLDDDFQTVGKTSPGSFSLRRPPQLYEVTNRPIPQ